MNCRVLLSTLVLLAAAVPARAQSPAFAPEVVHLDSAGLAQALAAPLPGMPQGTTGKLLGTRGTHTWIALRRETAPGETRGGEIAGGRERRMQAGDLIVVPAGIPHQVRLGPGEAVTYLIVKVRVAVG